MKKIGIPTGLDCHNMTTPSLTRILVTTAVETNKLQEEVEELKEQIKVQ